MEILDNINNFFTGVSGGNIPSSVVGMALIVAIIIILRKLVRTAKATVKIGCTTVGIFVILWILSGMM